MRRWILPMVAATWLAGCGPADPNAARIDNIQDMAEAEADALESDADNQAGKLRAEADWIAAQAGNAHSFDAERLGTRADALRKEAQIVERHGKAKAQAVRDRARAEVSAIKAE